MAIRTRVAPESSEIVESGETGPFGRPRWFENHPRIVAMTKTLEQRIAERIGSNDPVNRGTTAVR
jgi:hypothetical protein